jgi:hypothetical protein
LAGKPLTIWKWPQFNSLYRHLFIGSLEKNWAGSRAAVTLKNIITAGKTRANTIRQAYWGRKAAGLGEYKFNLMIFIRMLNNSATIRPSVLPIKGNIGPNFFNSLLTFIIALSEADGGPKISQF